MPSVLAEWCDLPGNSVDAAREPPFSTSGFANVQRLHHRPREKACPRMLPSDKGWRYWGSNVSGC